MAYLDDFKALEAVDAARGSQHGGERCCESWQNRRR